MTKVQITPYLFFGGRCEEALEFYKSALKADIEVVMHFHESPDPVPEGMLKPGFENKVMHASFQVHGNTIMASDGCGESRSFQGISLALTLATESDVDQVFEALADGGTVQMPLGKTFWSNRYGIVEDRFGMNWMVMVASE
jgi:PhnB protein